MAREHSKCVSTTKDQDFFISISLNVDLNSLMWLEATVRAKKKKKSVSTGACPQTCLLSKQVAQVIPLFLKLISEACFGTVAHGGKGLRSGGLEFTFSQCCVWVY